MKSQRNSGRNLSGNLCARAKHNISKFYHDKIYVGNEGRHIKVSGIRQVPHGHCGRISPE
jgi:hypothetical protein